LRERRATNAVSSEAASGSVICTGSGLAQRREEERGEFPDEEPNVIAVQGMHIKNILNQDGTPVTRIDKKKIDKI
jgi:hypothetical protein